MTHTSPVTNQDAFRGREDSGNEATPTWIDVANANWSQNVDEDFRVRFVIQETAGGSASNLDLVLFYDTGGGYAAVTASTPIQFGAFTGATDGDATTAQLGSGSFTAGELDSNATVSAVSLNNTETEMEYCLTIDSAQVANNDTINLRVYDGTTALNNYTNTPTITVVEVTTSPISGTSDGAATTQGAITGDGLIAGTSDGVATTQGAVTGTGYIAGSTDGVATTQGDLAGKYLIAGSSDGVATTQGAVTGTGYIAGTSSGAATTQGAITGTAAIAGSTDGVATTQGAITGDGFIAGTSSGSVTVQGSVTGTGYIAGTSNGAATTQGIIFDSASGAISGTASGVATTQGAGHLIAAISGTVTVGGQDLTAESVLEFLEANPNTLTRSWAMANKGLLSRLGFHRGRMVNRPRKRDDEIENRPTDITEWKSEIDRRIAGMESSEPVEFNIPSLSDARRINITPDVDWSAIAAMAATTPIRPTDPKPVPQTRDLENERATRIANARRHYRISRGRLAYRNSINA